MSLLLWFWNAGQTLELDFVIKKKKNQLSLLSIFYEMKKKTKKSKDQIEMRNATIRITQKIIDGSSLVIMAPVKWVAKSIHFIGQLSQRRRRRRPLSQGQGYNQCKQLSGASTVSPTITTIVKRSRSFSELNPDQWLPRYKPVEEIAPHNNSIISTNSDMSSSNFNSTINKSSKNK